ncbi:MAG: phosphoribosylaminoimidazolesuccinocarboxamide synthase, partial [Nanoarchaeota archaeon]
SLPKGSSIFKRLKEGMLNYQDLGLDHPPKPGEVLPKPLIEVTTKLESTDRHLSWEEAREITGMVPLEEYALHQHTLTAARVITDFAQRAGLNNEDGKVEYARDSRGKLMLVDVFGTPDECRFTMQGMPVSKEIARQFYQGSAWQDAVIAAKLEAKQKGTSDWKNLCPLTPGPLPFKLLDIISQMYMSTANAFLGRKAFDSSPLEKVVERYMRWKTSHS